MSFNRKKKATAETVNDSIVTVELLSRAIKRSIRNRKMDESDAFNMAYHIMNFFGFNDRILDNILEPEDRDAFYMLEDNGILVTEREETTLYDGREWRIHYWIFKKDRIHELVTEKGEDADSDLERSRSIYEELSENLWIRSVNEAEDSNDAK